MATATPEYKVILLGEYGVGKTTFLNQVQRITRHVDIFEADHVECTIPVGPPEERVTAKVRNTMVDVLMEGRIPYENFIKQYDVWGSTN